MQPLNPVRFERSVFLPAVVVVAGPTASGKTALAVALAQRYGGEVVSADSMQIYREMDIGTAKPAAGEMGGVPHHMLDFLPPGASFSVADFMAGATAAIDGILARGRLPVVCGGTGQYLHALMNNLAFTGNPVDEALRRGLRERLEREGADALYEQLLLLDRAAAETLHKNNTVRLLRALELALSGSPKTANNLRSRTEAKYRFLLFTLNYADRSRLYERINRRVEVMFGQGLEEEARALRNRYGKTAAAAIGYKELEPYFDGEIPLEQAKEKIRAASRAYAKRQLTWLRPLTAANWLYPDRADPLPNAGKILQCAMDCCIL